MSLEEFYKEAPPEISRPAITLSEPHQQTLARLDWELEQRKRWVSGVSVWCQPAALSTDPRPELHSYWAKQTWAIKGSNVLLKWSA